jgi:hypothetical protein
MRIFKGRAGKPQADADAKFDQLDSGDQRNDEPFRALRQSAIRIRAQNRILLLLFFSRRRIMNCGCCRLEGRQARWQATEFDKKRQ